MKSKKGDAMYEVINDSGVSFYGWLKNSGGEYTSNNGWIRAQFTKSGSSLTVTYPEGETTQKYATGLYDGDYTLIGTCVRPFVNRGGSCYYDSGEGVFHIFGSNGGAVSSSSFRPVLW